MIMNNTYNTVKFSDIYQSIDDFICDYNRVGFPDNLKRESLEVLYLLLYGRYGNNPIANLDLNQFAIKLFSIVFQYGPTWEKRLEIQTKLRDLSEDDLVKSHKAVHNHAYNPDTAPGTASLDELAYINDQSTSTQIRPKLDAYGMLWELLDNDVSEEFLGRFKTLFKLFVKSEETLLYGDEETIQALNAFNEGYY